MKKSDGNNVSIKVFHKPNKLPLHWYSQTPRRYKRNAVTWELHCALMISDDFNTEVNNIREKYANAVFPYGFVTETINKIDFKDLINGFPKFVLIPKICFDVSDKPKQLYGSDYLFAVKMKTFRGHI